MSSKSRLAVALTAFMVLSASPALAVFQNGTFDPILDPPLLLDDSWVVIDEFMSTGDFFTGSFTWTSPYAVRFRITDLFVVTDAFEVYDFGSLALTTPILPEWDDLGFADPFDSPPWTNDPDVAYADARFSKGSILFAAGSHSITIRDIHIPSLTAGGSPFPDGTVAFSAAPVPEPGTLTLLGLGLLGVRTVLRRKKAS